MKPLIYSLQFLELIACVTGFVNWNKLKDTFWRFLPFYLLFIVFQEIAGKVITNISGTNMYSFQYFALPANFIFFFWLLFKCLSISKFKNLPIPFSFIYLVALLIDILYNPINIHHFFNTFSYSIAVLLLFILIMCYFYNFLNSGKIMNFKSDISFWVFTGFLVFYLGSLPFLGLLNILYVT